jgi:uncharacterized sulfatase
MRLAAVSATLVLLLVPCSSGRCADTKPSFVVVVADDVSWDCFGCTGSKHARTPNIDRLATQGLRLDNMYCAVSQCAPCRAELYTGLYPHHNGVLANAVNRKVPGVKSIVDHLAPLGYKVGLTGKSHFNKGAKFTGISGFPGSCNSSVAEHSLDGVKSFITEARREGAPFCVFICSIHAHHPWDLGAPADFPHNAIQLPDHYIDSPLAREAIARHAAEVELLDRQVGDTMAMLDEMGLARDTVLLFLSEQGTAMPRGKWTIYNYGCRALGLVRWPGRIAPRRTDAVTQYCDVVPTFIELAGGTPRGLDGRSMRELWLGKSDEHREFAFISNTNPVWQRSIVTKDYKLIWSPVRDGTYVWRNFFSASKFFSKPWTEWTELAKSGGDAKAKVDRVQLPDELELYRVDKDPYELRNLAADPKHSARAREMLARLKGYMAEVGDTEGPGAGRKSKGKKKGRKRGGGE